MPNVNVLNIKGEVVGTIALSDEVFSVEINEDALHSVVVNQLANRRQGTQSTKTRAEVRGGGRKPWRQKGTGRARQGSIRAPQWIHGGIALGPKPRDYSYTLNKKLKRIAMKSALTSKVQTENIIVLNELALNEYKTKQMISVLNNIHAGDSALIVIDEKNDFVVRSADNIPGIRTAYVNTMNVYDLLKYSKLIITKAAIEKVQEVYV